MATPKFDFNTVYDQLIEEAGKTRVVYINGIFTNEVSDQGSFDSAVDEVLKLRKNSYVPTNTNFRSSINFTPQYNPTSPGTGGNIIEDLGLSVAKFFVRRALDAFSVFDILEIPGQIIAVADLMNSFLSSPNPAQLFQDDDFTAKALSFLSDYLPGGDIIADLIGSLPDDLQESLTQYWYRNTAISRPINQNWTQGGNSVVNWNNQSSKNSLVLIGYSQGNFFVEDGLIDLGSQLNSSRVRVLALGSPTMYSSAGGLGLYKGKNIINGNDPVTKLQLNSGELDNVISKISHIFQLLSASFSIQDHFLDNYLKPDLQVAESFKNFVYELHPKGFYFPAGTFSTTGTTNDDWIKGNGTLSGGGRNDVLQGGIGNDTLIGGDGYDLLDGDGDEDGGVWKDTANYSSSPQGIVVSAKTIAGSDVYEVQDGFGTVDTLGNIEVISGTEFKDIFNGGKFSDIFYGQGGDDEFYGQGGNDEFYGGAGADIGFGGEDNDILRGDDGTDYLYGGDGIDYLYGGDDIDYLYGGNGKDYIYGEEGDDHLFGEDGRDTIVGGAGRDIIRGGAGKDIIFGDFQNGLSGASTNAVSSQHLTPA